MGQLLKALGLTIWGLTALGLAAVFIFVGYQAALRYRSTNAPENAVPLAAPPLEPDLPMLARSDPEKPPQPDGNAAGAPGIPSLDITRPLFQDAEAQHRDRQAIEYGQQMMDDGLASAEDMVSIAHSYVTIGDCSNARATMDKADAALHAAGRELNESQRQVTLNCHETARVAIDPAHQERVNRLLQILRARAQAQRDALPRLEAEAAAAQSGNPAVILGEAYYGFGEYGKAAEAIKRGLDKGNVRHLDDAYVYLGRAERAQGDIDAARKAFAHLKEVPGIDPRVLKLWTLYAEVELQGAPARQTNP